MKVYKLLLFILISALVVFSVFLIQQRTNNIREQEAAAAGLNLKIASDPNFQEFLGKIATGFPADFPVYSGAELVGSAINNPPGLPDSHYTVKWHFPADTSVVDLIFWYKQELEALGWKIEDPDIWEGISDLVVQVENENYKGAIFAEDEGDEVEFVADLKIKK